MGARLGLYDPQEDGNQVPVRVVASSSVWMGDSGPHLGGEVRLLGR